MKTARGFETNAEEREAEANEKRHASHEAHQRGVLFDISELAVDLALVLCSIAVLTKRNGFWLTGIACGVAGALVAASVFVLH